MGKNKGCDKGMGTQGSRCKDYVNDKNKDITVKGSKEKMDKGMGTGRSKGWGEDEDNYVTLLYIYIRTQALPRTWHSDHTGHEHGNSPSYCHVTSEAQNLDS